MELLIASYEKLEGTAKFAPYVDCHISAIDRDPQEVVFKARIDTGTDCTCIPRQYVRHLIPLHIGGHFLSRDFTGRIIRSKHYKLTVNLHLENEVKAFTPELGILLTDADTGLIGMDILNDLDVRVCNETLYIYERGG